MQERVIDQRELATGKLVTLRHDTVVDHNGRDRLREVVIHRGGVAVVPLLDDGRLILVRQYRYAVGETLLELPAGTLDRLESGDLEDPDEAVRRELGEETGHRAGEWRKLGRFYTAPGFMTEVMHLYLATGLEAIDGYDGPEEDEQLEVELVPVEEAFRLAQSGGLADAKTLVGVLWLARLIERGEVRARA